METRDLTSGDHHFAIGKNWADYSRCIDESRIDAAARELARLLDMDLLCGRSFLDIGCGSGLHSLAALRLGAGSVFAIDVDGDSVSTTTALLTMHSPGTGWKVERRSVFELRLSEEDRFDVVYSWGVLHHTGDLCRALLAAASAVATDGLLVVAFYRPVWTEALWKLEKRWYSQTSSFNQRWVRRAYGALFTIGLLASGRQPARYFQSYADRRGMSFEHDVHDWLGGWPYESIAASELEDRLNALGFVPVRQFVRPRTARNFLGDILGSGCDEFVFMRRIAPSPKPANQAMVPRSSA